MRKIFGCSALLVSVLLLVSGPSPGQQPKNKNNSKNNKDKVTKEETTPEDYASLAKVKDFIGKVSDVNLTTGVVIVTVEYEHYEPNPNVNNKGDQKLLKLQQQLQNDYNKILTTKNAAQRQQAMANYQLRLQQLQAQGAINLQNMFVLVKSSKDVELNTVEKLKVARSKLEAKYNDEGELIKYTAAELKKMKSSDITGAYTATPEDIRVGQIVKLYLNPPKKDSTTKPATDTKKADTNAKGVGSSLGDILSKQSAETKEQTKDDGSTRTIFADRPQIRMVLIMDNPGVPELTDPLKK